MQSKYLCGARVLARHLWCASRETSFGVSKFCDLACSVDPERSPLLSSNLKILTLTRDKLRHCHAREENGSWVVQMSAAGWVTSKPQERLQDAFLFFLFRSYINLPYALRRNSFYLPLNASLNFRKWIWLVASIGEWYKSEWCNVRLRNSVSANVAMEWPSHG